MISISGLLKELQKALLHCGLNEQKLHHVFAIHHELRSWQHQLPKANNLQGQVNATIAFLQTKETIQGQNALVLFVRTFVTWEIPEGDACHHDLLELADKLDIVLNPPPEILNADPPTTATEITTNLPENSNPNNLTKKYSSWLLGVIGLSLVIGILALGGFFQSAHTPSATVALFENLTTPATTTITPSTTTIPISPTPKPSQTPIPSQTFIPSQTPTQFPNTPTVEPSQTPTPSTTPTYTPSPTPLLGVGSSKTSEVDGMVQTFVPADEFTMGSTEAKSNIALDACKDVLGEDECQEEAYEIEKPSHLVFLDAFWVDKYEVTNAQFQDCVTNGLCDEPNCEFYTDNDFRTHPVVCINWQNAHNYCRWAGRALPTEAQWEKVARGLDSRIYPWGDNFDSSRLNFCDEKCATEFAYSWANEGVDDGYAYTAPVGTYPTGVSPYGAFDMAGNVREWVADWYHNDYYENAPFESPINTNSSNYRLIRGGSWDSTLDFVRGAKRVTIEPTSWNNYTGFRCVQEAELGVGSGKISSVDEMIQMFVPDGIFIMGKEEDIRSRAEDFVFSAMNGIYDTPIHKVYLDAFWVDKYEVTNNQFRGCVADGACDAPITCDDSGESFYDNIYTENEPVICVNWQNAQNYCVWAGRTLPTEAQWEKAARGVDGRTFPWGNDSHPCELSNGCGEVSDAGSYTIGESPYGVVDIINNIGEWVEDWYSPDYYDTAPTHNPVNTSPYDPYQTRVIRRSPWLFNRDPITGRDSQSPGVNVSYIGFRCVQEAGSS